MYFNTNKQALRKNIKNLPTNYSPFNEEIKGKWKTNMQPSPK